MTGDFVTVTREDDPAQFDPFLKCDLCGEHLCTVEEGDTFSVLVSVVMSHEAECTKRFQ